jgi:elongation of very long chain fatty acids protein 6
LYHHYPALSPFYTEFEKNYDPIPILHNMINNNYIVPTVCVLAYLLFCYFGKNFMKNRQPFGLNSELAYWNLFLSLFSAYGAIRTVPHLIHRIATHPFEDTVCESVYSAYGGGACGLAVMLFILSKIPELVDTVFIVLRKKPLIFLHWYHHVTVLVFCWNSYVTKSAAGLWFVAMNYTVHAVMYFYFYLQSIKSIPKWFPTPLITLMQITQMIVGCFIVGASCYYYLYGGKFYKPGECQNSLSNMYVGLIIYGSYLYLFVEFAVGKFIFGDAHKKPKSTKKVATD